jgi:hypothetical protein
VRREVAKFEKREGTKSTEKFKQRRHEGTEDARREISNAA